MAERNKIVYKTYIDKDNYVVRDHKVHDVAIMPGVTFLDMIYRCLYNKGFDTENIILKNILFLEPIYIIEDEIKEIRITITINEDGTSGTILAENTLSLEKTKPEWITNLKAEIDFQHKKEISTINVDELIAQSIEKIDLDKSYSFAREMHINHKEFMKALGTMYLGNGYILAEVRLSNLAEEYLEDFFLHPVYLDSSTIVPGYLYYKLDKKYEPSIPIYIEKFYSCSQLSEKKYYVYIDTNKCGSDSIDIIHTSICMYSENGIGKVYIDGLKSKRIRSQKDLIVSKVKDKDNEVDIEADMSIQNSNVFFTKDDIVDQLRNLVAKFADVPVVSIKNDSDFYDIGLDSVGLIQMVRQMEKMYDEKFYPTLLFEYMNIEVLSSYLYERLKEKKFISNNFRNETDKTNMIKHHKMFLYEVNSLLEEIDNSIENTILISNSDSNCGYISSNELYNIVHNYEEKGGCLERIIYCFDKKEIISDEKYAAAKEIISFLKSYTKLKKHPKMHLVVKCNESHLKKNHEFEAMSGLLKSIERENTMIKTDMLFGGKQEQLYKTYYKKIEYNGNCMTPYKNNGVYIITGGMGGLGKLFAKRIASLVNANIILLGRTSFTEEKQEFVKQIEKMGSFCVYKQVDMSDVDEVHKIAKQIEEKYSFINGVIHCAGVLRDMFLRDMKNEDFDLVCDTKINGFLGLDEALSAQKLDFFVVFSSITALTGNMGQGSYAYANAYMDSLMKERAQKVKEGKRFGRSVSINWPLWENGGMKSTINVVEEMQNRYHMGLLQDCDGVEAFEQILASSANQVLVYYGDEESINELGLEVYTSDQEKSQKTVFKEKDIAIIGIAGQYPMADDVEEYWKNILEGRDCIQEIPADRWDAEEYFSNNKQQNGTTYSKWGGFIKNPAMFDPMFFNITPKEAELMDPQERLFLECAWNTIQDAGYTKKQLGKKVGVFVGVMWGQYQLIGIDELNKGNVVTPNSFYASIANRVSYWFDFMGPSMAVDTMCSSSLTAIHLACKSILEQECETAIAGGVNIIVHPSKYLFLSANKMCSSDGKCRAFGEGGDGYVPGEGIGAILLKPLDKAIEDKDYIYGVIKGSSLNHGGKTSGFSVPNPRAQAEVIKDAYDRANISPETITYVEAHGTGTFLGDPIEIEGLSKVFSANKKLDKTCYIGSVKSNIGHLESAAGIAGITKILLQMKHNKLVSSLHTEVLNPNIDFEQSHFNVVTEVKDWYSEDENCNLRAAISAFGAGGSNAHVIIEEYKNNLAEVVTDDYKETNLFVLSAHTKDNLIEYIKKYEIYLSDNGETLSLKQLAYVLQNKREHMEYRVAFIVKTMDELKKCLRKFITGSSNEELLKSYNNDVMYEKAIAYINGKDVDFYRYWNEVYTNIPLPTYPFSKEKYWIPISEKNNTKVKIHPLISQNISTLHEQCFETIFTGKEYFIKNHIISGRITVPGAILLEMAKKACEISDGRKVRSIKDLVWKNSVTLEENSFECKLSVSVIIQDKEILFQINNHTENGKKLISTGKCEFYSFSEDRDEENKQIDLKRFLLDVEEEIETLDIYDRFKQVDIIYGDGFKLLKKIFVKENRAVAVAKIDVNEKDDLADCDVHPLLIDAAFQSVCAFAEEHKLERFLPYSIDSIKFYNTYAREIYIYSEIKENDDKSKCFYIALCDKEGRVITEIETLKILKANDINNLILYRRSLVEKQLHDNISNLQTTKNVLLVDDNKELCLLLRNQGYHVTSLNLGSTFKKVNEELYEADFWSKESMGQLLKSLTETMNIPDVLIYGLEKDKNEDLSPYFAIIQTILTWHELSELKCIYYYKNDAKKEKENSLRAAIEGFNKSVNQEQNKIKGKVVAFDRLDNDILALEVVEEIYSPFVIYKEGKRCLSKYDEIIFDKIEPNYDGKTILITGGNGGLGLLFAKYFAKYKDVNIILCGRSLLIDKKKEIVEELRENGANVIYKQIDICDKESLAYMLKRLKTEFGIIHGVIHCAGVLNDKLLIGKKWDDFIATLKPKVLGLINLDNILRDEPLDFFVSFSSIASVIGSAGQTDYSYANSFLDHFMEERNKMVKQGKRFGHSLSINWPLWKDGFMKMNQRNISIMKNSTGIDVLNQYLGVKAFSYALSLKESQVIVLYGDTLKIREYFRGKEVKNTNKEIDLSSEDKSILYSRIEQYITHLIAKEIKVSEDVLSAKEPFEKYGIDSIVIMNVTACLENFLGTISKTLFFEYNTIKQISNYFLEYYSVQFAQELGNLAIKKQNDLCDNDISNYRYERFYQEKGNDIHKLEMDDIAIVGLSGQYPMADNLNEFWNNLEMGKNCITEIPRERWDNSIIYTKEKGIVGKNYGMYGGFINDIDKFDSMLFNIAPKDAEMIDPQERLFLQNVWSALEDSGHNVESLKNNKVGVFVGVMYGQYQLLGLEASAPDKIIAPNSSFSSIANRVSFFFDFKGPSIAVDTMCSSSLSALHLACLSIKNKECDVAVVGGVNICIHPMKYVQLSQGKFLSEDGLCKAFGEGGNGYVPGEGVGVVIIKSLRLAERDHDHIYGVIKATALNHGGKTNGYTVPSPNQQADVIQTALVNSGLDGSWINYIEAHGTGTSLGDPIEIRGLSQTIGIEKSIHSCPIGSVKSNIGHLESCAGMASIAKVLLQLKYKKLVPSIHVENLNQNINFSQSPFYVQNKLEEWKQPIKIINGKETIIPRCAGISAFGAGGSNAHVIISEYLDEKSMVQIDGKHIFILSARTKERLKFFAKSMKEYVEQNKDKISLYDLAYTMQVGKNHLEERAVIFFETSEELINELNNILNQKESEKINYGRRKNYKEYLIKLGKIEEDTYINNLIKHSKLEELANLWVNGFDIDWEELYQDINEKPYRLSLPTYPFEKNSFWIQKSDNKSCQIKKSEEYELIDKNCSSIHEVKFLKKFDSDAEYIRHHKIHQSLVVPGALFMEFALEAGNLAYGQTITGLANIVFEKELIVVDHENVNISFEISNNGDLTFEIWEEKNGYVYAKGQCLYDTWSQIPNINLQKKRSLCNKYISGQEFYTNFGKAEFCYGSYYKNIEEAWYDKELVIARFKTSVQNTKYIITPSLIDVAFQSVSLLVQSEIGYLPYSVGRFRLFETEFKEGYLVAEKKNNNKNGELKFDIIALSENGTVLFEITDFVLKQRLKEEVLYDTIWLEKEWVESSISKEENTSKNNVIEFIVGNNTIIDLDLANEDVIRVYNGKEFHKVSKNQYLIDLMDYNAYKKCMEEIKKDFSNIDSILYCFDELYMNNKLNLAEQLEKSILPLVTFMKAYGTEMKVNPVNLLVQVKTTDCIKNALVQAIEGFFRTLNIEYPKAGFKIVECDSREICLMEMCLPFKGYEYIKHVKGQRFKQSLKIQTDNETKLDNIVIKSNQTYIVTGGMGGLGLIFAKYLIQDKGCNVALLGRRKLDNSIKLKLSELDSSGDKVLYISADLTNYEDIQQALLEVKEKYGAIHGILHTAGILNDSLLEKKSIEDFKKVIEPKIFGTVWLDELTKDEPIQLFCTFSSTSSVLGNIGQADYAYANSFMDAYILVRSRMVNNNRKYLSINWPLWKNGGMQVNQNTEKMLKETAGIMPLCEEVGINLFEKCINQNTANAMFLYGLKSKIVNIISGENQVAIADNNEKIAVSKEEKYEITQLIVETICELLKVNKNDIYLDTEFNELGFDSISYSDLCEHLNEKNGSHLTPATFFEYTNVDDLAEYMLKERGCLVDDKEISHVISSEKVNGNKELVKAKMTRKHTIPSLIQAKTKQLCMQEVQATDSRSIKEDIAIIGMSGKMPKSDDLCDFWENLINNKDMIEKIPEERWKIEDYYGNPQEDDNKTDVIYGGFMNDIQSFDANFFGILPREAELMDPQQRLFLETVWKTIEDAGYRMSDLNGTDTGVFVGVAASDYNRVLSENNIDITAQSSTGMSHSVLANRISYLFNWYGPSEPIDTACSSSLVAIHNAINSLWLGECSMAIAGGVNVILDPDLYISFSKAGMLSQDGRCKTFDESANGYVRGEGVGAVLLKPLSKAIKDNDHIYAVIKSSVVNHGGKANSLTSPNPNAQAKLIAQAYKDAQIDINTVTYIEAHGTGTSLGDPIEINGLKKAFQMVSEDNGILLQNSFCGIGSVKTNVGHLETAAGMAGLFKILLSMKNRKIPSNLHFNKLNSYISLENSPFYIMNNNMEWRVKKDENGNDIPRRAGISSFGYGGVNAHLVLEEYMEPLKEQNMIEPQIIVLSAKTKDSLDRKISHFYNYCLQNKEEFDNYNFLENVSYTLQVGREEFEHRVSFVVECYDELLLKLKQILDKEIRSDIYFSQDILNSINEILSSKEMQMLVSSMLEEKEYNKIAKLWSNRFCIDWKILHKKSINKISLPTYSFQKDRFWVKKNYRKHSTGFEKGMGLGKLINSVEIIKSYEDGIAFTMELKKNEPIISHHIVNKKKVFVGMGYIEAVLEAVNAIGVKKGIVLKDIFFRRMLFVEEESEFRVWLTKNDSLNHFRITDINYQNIYACGDMLVKETDVVTEYVNIEKFEFTNSLVGTQLYQKILNTGIEYGPMFRAIVEVSWNDTEALSYIQLDSEYAFDFNDYIIHPVVMDAALQTISVLWSNEKENDVVVPYSIQRIEIRQNISTKMYAYVKKQDDNMYNIVLINENGEVCVVLYGVYLKELCLDTEKNNMCYLPIWKPILR